MDKPKRLKMISVRASEQEIARVKELAAQLIKKNPHLKEANILRELLGLVDTGIVTAEMRWRLSHPEPTPDDMLTRPFQEGDDMAAIYDEEEGEIARKQGRA